MKRLMKPLSKYSAVATLLALPFLASCNDTDLPGGDVCGECGTLEGGQLSISGNAQLDGLFTAVGTLGKANARISGDFEANIAALGSVYGLAEGEVNAAFVDELVAAIQLDIDSHVGASGGLKIAMTPAECSASLDVAFDAQAQCEVQAGCEVEVDPGEASVQCEGTCEGSCSGSCSGEFSCKVEAPGVECSGMCEGSCELTAAATCEGTCHGSCDVGCSSTDASGECHGTCEGMCDGTCEVTGGASCEGSCHGTCKASPGSVECDAEGVECSGSCDAECSGGCEGNFTPPSASADCDASADCEVQASAQASASVECTPPSIDIDFEFDGTVTADAKASFVARLGELKVRGAAILQGAAQLKALVDGEVNGEVVFSPSPVVEVTGALEGLIDAGIEGDFDVPIAKIPCTIDAFKEAVPMLASIGTEATATISAQAKFGAIFTGG